MGSDLEKAARMFLDETDWQIAEQVGPPTFDGRWWENLDALRAALPEEDDRDPFVDLNATVSNILTHLGLDEWGKPIPEHHKPAPPAVTREEVEAFITEHEESAGWGTVVRMLRSWLVLEASNAYLSVRVERLSKENAKLRAVAEAAEERHGTRCKGCELCDALRRLKGGE